MPLSWRPLVKSLDFSFSEVSDLSPLAGLTQLRDLTLGPKTRDLAPLAQLEALRELDISQVASVDLSPLSNLRGLKLILGSRFTELKSLAKLIHLDTLILKGTKTTDLAPLASLSSLRDLELAPAASAPTAARSP